jgi:hypothetical protein
VEEPARTPEVIRAELRALRALLQQAERQPDDPNARMAADLFRAAIRRREWELLRMVTSPRPERT